MLWKSYSLLLKKDNLLKRKSELKWKNTIFMNFHETAINQIERMIHLFNIDQKKKSNEKLN